MRTIATLTRSLGHWAGRLALLGGGLLAGQALAANFDLVLNHTDSPDPVVAGVNVTYTITVNNAGDNATVDDIQVTNTLPAGITFVSAVPAQGSCDLTPLPAAGDTFTCDLGSLVVGATTSIAVTVTTSASGIVTNVASVTSTTGGFVDPDPANNSQNEDTTVTQGANLSIVKSAVPHPSVQSGSTLAYSLTVGNAGPDPASSVRVVDTLPPGFNVTSLPGGCSQAGQTVTCDMAGSIGVGGSSVIGPINGQISVSSGSTLTNLASVEVTSLAAPQDPIDNNTTTLITSVTAGSDVAVGKSQSLANPVTTGTTFAYTLSPRYTGDAPVNVTVTDNVPGNLTVTSASGAGWDCSATVGNAVSCSRASGGAAAGYNVAMPAITVQVTADTAGNVNNTVNVASASPNDPIPGNNSATIATNVVPAEADLYANKTALRDSGAALTPALVITNDTFKWRLSAGNNGPSAFTGALRLTDNLPAGVRVDSYTHQNPVYWTCAPAEPVVGPAIITCETAPATVLANGATSPYVELNVTATAAAVLNNTATTANSAGTPNDGNAGNNSGGATITSQNNPNSADLQLLKTENGPVTAGDLLTYTLEIVNLTDGVTSTNIVLTDTLSQLIDNQAGAGHGLESASITTVGTSAGGVCNSSANGNSARDLSCSFTSIAPCIQGNNCPIVTVQVRPNGASPRSNSGAVYSYDVADPNLANNVSNTVNTTVNQRTDVTASITGTPPTVQVGANLTYVATAINQGVSAAANAEVTIILPEGVTFLSATPAAGVCSTTPVVGALTTAVAKTVICNLGTLPLPSPGNTTTQAVTIVVRPTMAVDGGGIAFPRAINADVSVTTTTAETNAGNNSASTSTQVSAPSHDLLVNKSDSVDPVAKGDNTTYNITVTNNGPSYATDVRVVDTLPLTKLAFVSATPSSGACGGVVGGQVTCNIGDLAAGANKTVAVVMTGSVKGIANNSVTVTSEETRASAAFDPLPGNNSVTEDTTVRTKADPEVVSKVARNQADTADITEIGLRRPFKWRINVRNNAGAGLDEADNTVVSDTLPANMELTATPSVTVTGGSFSSSTCTGAAGGTSFTCSLGTVSSGATGTITVPVRVLTVATPSTGTDVFSNSATITTSSLDINSPTMGVNNNTNSGSVNVLSSSLAGRVWADSDDSGGINGLETGINGVTITLSGTPWDASVFANRTAVTDTLVAVPGIFKFTGLPEGSYTITEFDPANAPAGHVDGQDVLGTIDAVGAGVLSNDKVTGIALGEHKDGVNYLFGEIPDAAISGRVFEDLDGDGVQDPGEPGISNVTLTLTGTDDQGTPVNRGATTNGTGDYSIAGLRPSNGTGYTLTQTQPDGYEPGRTTVGALTGAGAVAGTLQGGVTGNVIDGIKMVIDSAGTNYNFGEVRRASIAGFAYVDTDGDASKDAGETVGIPGATITLTGTDFLGAAVGPTVTATLANGSYSFSNLLPGSYTVTETKPAGLDATGAQVGSGAGVPAGTAGSNLASQFVQTIAIPSNGALTNYNFGHQGTSLSGYVYLDLNNDGTKQLGEPGIAGVGVTLSGNTLAGGDSVCGYIGGVPACTKTTGADGSFIFTQLPASDATGYTLTEQSQAALPLSNFGDGQDARGTVAAVLTGTTGNDVISGIVIAQGQTGVDYRFGERGASLSGRVYHDSNDDGDDDAGANAGISGVTITLTGTKTGGGNPCADLPGGWCTATTDASGNYSFTGLPAGVYALTESQPLDFANRSTAAGTPAGVAGDTSITGINLTSGQSGSGYLFGEKTNSVSGFVYFDANNNGVKDLGETGISGVSVSLSGNIASNGSVSVCTTIPSCTTTTSPSGAYEFSGLRKASVAGYTVSEVAATVPDEYSDGSDGASPSSAGSQGGTRGNDVLSAIGFDPASPATNYNFGERKRPTLTKSFNPTRINPGDTAQLIITLGNPNAVDITLSAPLVDTLPVAPGLMTLANASTAGSTCTAGAITANAGAGTVTYASGATIPPGNCTIVVNVTASASGNYVNTLAAGSLKTDAGDNPSPASANLIVSAYASISGKVYADLDNDGNAEAGEKGIGGVTITLTGASEQSTVTGANGSYAFTNLLPGVYHVTQPTQPVGYDNGITTPGTRGGRASATSVLPSSIRDIVLDGVDSADNNFGELIRQARISGKVYLDLDNDGVADAGESGLGGVAVALSGYHFGPNATDDNGLGDDVAVSQGATTNAIGDYSFADLNPGRYTVTEPTQPANTRNGKTTAGTMNGALNGTATGVAVLPSAISGIALNGVDATGNNFGEIPAASISGLVFEDTDGDGVRDVGEPGIPGVTLTLTGTDDLGATVSATTTAAADGSWSFSDLRPGSYTVTETQPVDYAEGAILPGTAGGTGSAPGGNSRVTGVTLSSGLQAVDYLFGEKTGGLSGQVFLDADADGVHDAGESLIPGVTLTLTGTTASGAAVNLTASSDANGAYAFSGLKHANAGGYTVTESHPALYLDGRETAGSQDGVVNNASFGANPEQNRISGIAFNAGNPASGYDFAEVQAATLRGRVYEDQDGDEVPDAGEPGLPGVVITLTRTDDQGATVTRSVTTGADGTYRFEGLRPGTYVLTETQPADYSEGRIHVGTLGGVSGLSGVNSQITDIRVGSGVEGRDYLFGEKTGTVSGYVYLDADNDGVHDSGETGIAGVTLRLTGTTPSGAVVALEATSDSNGAYAFTGLKNANGEGYTVTETHPATYLDGRETAGSQGGVVDNGSFGDAPAQNRIATIPFNAGAVATEYNFGELAPASIAGKVWHDFAWGAKPLNGVQDADEPGLGNVTLTLSGTDDLGAAVTPATVLTAADGTYRFDNLRPGNYVVTQSQPPGIDDFPAAEGTYVGTINGTATGAASLNRIDGIVLAPGNQGVEYNFRERAGVLLGGYVYEETGGDITRMDGSDPGIPGVTVTLVGSDGGACASGASQCASITDASGAYYFAGLRAGTYSLVETHPVIYKDHNETLGAVSPASASNGAIQAPDSMTGIRLGVAAAASGYNFGELQGVIANVAGRVWINTGSGASSQYDPDDKPIEGWIVELWHGEGDAARRVGEPVLTDPDGRYNIQRVTPDYNYTVRFIHPITGRVFGKPVVNGGVGRVAEEGGQIEDITVPSGASVDGLDLPIDPSGVVYDSDTGAPVAGATVTMSCPGLAETDIVGDTSTQVTDASGVYAFFVKPTAPALPSILCTFNVTGPAALYTPGLSSRIPACANTLRIGAPGAGSPDPSLVQDNAAAPGAAERAAWNTVAACSTDTNDGTFLTGSTDARYYRTVEIRTAAPASTNLINNNLPIDPVLEPALRVRKTTPLLNVRRGDLVPYTITATNGSLLALTGLDLRDRLPPGFQYKTGSATLDQDCDGPLPAVAVEPVRDNRELNWPGLNFAGSASAQSCKRVRLMLVVGAGVSEGQYINQAWVEMPRPRLTVSNVAPAPVRIVPDPVFDCSDIIGKVFDDQNANGYQDEGEPGIPNVRVATARGLLVTSDQDGRFHVACADIPQAQRGSNFFMKLDERTLPSGYRITTENPREVRTTRGKMVKLNFGAAIHRVVRLELRDAAFERDSAKPAAALARALEKLPETLRQKPSVVRLAYQKGADDLAKDRLRAVREWIEQRWKESGCCYTLIFEEEIFERASAKTRKEGVK